LHKVENYLASI